MKTNNTWLIFAIKWIFLYFIFDFFCNFWIGLCAPGGYYWKFAHNHLDFIAVYRSFLLLGTSFLAKTFGYISIYNYTELRIIGKGGIRIVYSCVGYGMLSLLFALAIAVPYKSFKQRLLFALLSFISFTCINIIRLFSIAFFYKPKHTLDHHTVFNIICYTLILITMYFWIKPENKLVNTNEK